MTTAGEIRPHMEIIGVDGGHVGIVGHLDSDHIRLTFGHDPAGSGRHRPALPLPPVDRTGPGRCA